MTVNRERTVTGLLCFFLCLTGGIPSGAEPVQTSNESSGNKGLSRLEIRGPALLNPRESVKESLLKGSVAAISGRTPFLSGSVETLPPETKIDFVLPPGVYLNSEVSQKGDEFMVRIGRDVVGEDGRVLLPKDWYARGLVTRAVSQKRGGRDGYVEVEFDKLVSPDRQYEVDFNARFSTKDSKLKTVTKLIAIDSAYVGIGSAAGALVSVQLTGIGGAIATQGYSVAIGAGVGATIGLIGALKRKGDIRGLYPGDLLSLTTAEPINLPGFDPEQFKEEEPVKKLEGLDLIITRVDFMKTPWKDKKARLLQLQVDVKNRSRRNFHFFDLIVESEQHQQYPQYMQLEGGMVRPNATGTGKVTFIVDSPKKKYSLVFLSRTDGKVLSRVPIN
ncbi:MAG: glycine zipper family protein [Candidatus Melainabacteria bacterium]|nr:glycine zipper family protein [Candidatus Melainabacteria bacterium]